MIKVSTAKVGMYSQPQKFLGLVFYFLSKQLSPGIISVWQELHRDSKVYKDLYGIPAFHQFNPIVNHLHKK